MKILTQLEKKYSKKKKTVESQWGGKRGDCGVRIRHICIIFHNETDTYIPTKE